MYPYAVVLTGMQINEPFQTSVLMQAKCEEKKNKNERKNNSTSLDSWESWVEIHSMKKNVSVLFNYSSHQLVSRTVLGRYPLGNS